MVIQTNYNNEKDLKSKINFLYPFYIKIEKGYKDNRLGEKYKIT